MASRQKRQGYSSSYAKESSVKVDDTTRLNRDPISKAVINTDMSGYEMLLAKRETSKLIQGLQEQINSLVKRIEWLENKDKRL